MSKVVIISGSLRKDSFNTKLANSIKNILETEYKDSVSEVKILDINFPLFNQDLESEMPSEVLNFKSYIESAEQIIFCTPEYNRSIPGVLKNAIDWASRPAGENSWVGKKVLTCGVSSGRLGTVSAQNELKKILNYFDCKVVGQPEIYIGPAEEMFDKAQNDFNVKTLEVVKKGLEKLLN